MNGQAATQGAFAPEVSRHKCIIYDGQAREQMAVLVPFLTNGLAEGWKCLYLGDPATVRAMREALVGEGVDVEAESRRGALVMTSERGHLDGGRFDPQIMIDALCRMIDESVQEGFRGLCATGDMRWELGDDASFDRLLEYEALLEQILRDKPVMGICQYHRATVPSRALRDALLTHRSLYLGSDLNRDNLFYVPPEILLQKQHRLDGDVGQWMCDQITRILRAERERDKALEELRRSEAEQRRLAESLAALNRDLERRVAARTTELQEANRELEAFTSSVSHDLRAPLRAIQGFARMLAEDQAKDLDAEGRRRVDVIVERAHGMGELIDDLLDLSRAGRAAMRRDPVDMNALVRRVVAELTAAGDGKAVVDVGDLPPAVGDPSLLRQVAINLVGNAIKYSGKRPDPRIEIGGRPDDGENVYWVKDNGVGFDMRYASKLFGVFQRLHDRSEFDGTGVGLALAKRILERHGGRLWAEAVEGRGATFSFSLPRTG